MAILAARRCLRRFLLFPFGRPPSFPFSREAFVLDGLFIRPNTAAAADTSLVMAGKYPAISLGQEKSQIYFQRLRKTALDAILRDRFMRYQQQYDGDIIRPQMRGYKIRCCDCGLVHVIDFRVVKVGRGHGVELKVKLDLRSTAASRRAKSYQR